jgi:ADP-heptose:LPS heptosyltransferase
MPAHVPDNIIISRTDSIGDVILTLPLARILKEQFPDIRVGFLGKAYTKAVIECCSYVDEFIDERDFLTKNITVCGQPPQAIIHVFPVKALAERSKALLIPLRTGTTNRIFHWWTCNRLVPLSRKTSALHEAQLNTKLLQPLGIDKEYSLEALGNSFGFIKVQPLPEVFRSLIDPARFNLILHPRSQGSAREWGLDNFRRLVALLPADQYKIFISGTRSERAGFNKLIDHLGNQVTDICGQMDLSTFISFINACDGLIANSTGPLHIAAALGKAAVGIYPNIRPMHPGRWQPLGPKATFVTSANTCANCRKQLGQCACMQDIKPETVLAVLRNVQ